MLCQTGHSIYPGDVMPTPRSSRRLTLQSSWMQCGIAIWGSQRPEFSSGFPQINTQWWHHVVPLILNDYARLSDEAGKDGMGIQSMTIQSCQWVRIWRLEYAGYVSVLTNQASAMSSILPTFFIRSLLPTSWPNSPQPLTIPLWTTQSIRTSGYI